MAVVLQPPSLRDLSGFNVAVHGGIDPKMLGFVPLFARELCGEFQGCLNVQVRADGMRDYAVDLPAALKVRSERVFRLARASLGTDQPQRELLAESVLEGRAQDVDFLLSIGTPAEPALVETVARNGSAETMQALLSHGVKPTKAAVNAAFSEGRFEVYTLLLDAGGRPSVATLRAYRDEFSKIKDLVIGGVDPVDLLPTLIYYATREEGELPSPDKRERILFLLKHGASRETAMASLARAGLIEGLRVLYACGVGFGNPEILLAALEGENRQVIQYVIEMGAPGGEVMRALAAHGQLELMQRLAPYFNFRVDPEIVRAAVEGGHRNVVAYLCEQGIPEDRRLVSRAVQRGKIEMAQMLVRGMRASPTHLMEEALDSYDGSEGARAEIAMYLEMGATLNGEATDRIFLGIKDPALIHTVVTFSCSLKMAAPEFWKSVGFWLTRQDLGTIDLFLRALFPSTVVSEIAPEVLQFLTAPSGRDFPFLCRLCAMQESFSCETRYFVSCLFWKMLKRELEDGNVAEFAAVLALFKSVDAARFKMYCHTELKELPLTEETLPFKVILFRALVDVSQDDGAVKETSDAFYEAVAYCFENDNPRAAHALLELPVVLLPAEWLRLIATFTSKKFPLGDWDLAWSLLLNRLNTALGAMRESFSGAADERAKTYADALFAIYRLPQVYRGPSSPLVQGWSLYGDPAREQQLWTKVYKRFYHSLVESAGEDAPAALLQGVEWLQRVRPQDRANSEKSLEEFLLGVGEPAVPLAVRLPLITRHLREKMQHNPSAPVDFLERALSLHHLGNEVVQAVIEMLDFEDKAVLARFREFLARALRGDQVDHLFAPQNLQFIRRSERTLRGSSDDLLAHFYLRVFTSAIKFGQARLLSDLWNEEHRLLFDPGVRVDVDSWWRAFIEGPFRNALENDPVSAETLLDMVISFITRSGEGADTDVIIALLRESLRRGVDGGASRKLLRLAKRRSSLVIDELDRSSGLTGLNVDMRLSLLEAIDALGEEIEGLDARVIGRIMAKAAHGIEDAGRWYTMPAFDQRTRLYALPFQREMNRALLHEKPFPRDQVRFILNHYSLHPPRNKTLLSAAWHCLLRGRLGFCFNFLGRLHF